MIWALAWLVCVGVPGYINFDRTSLLLFWPASGVSVAAFHITPYRHWISLTLAMLMANIAAILFFEFGLFLSIGFIVANISQGFLCGGMAKIVLDPGREVRSTVSQPMQLFASTFAGTLIAMIMTWPFRENMTFENVTFWVFSSILGIMAVTPLIYLFGVRPHGWEVASINEQRIRTKVEFIFIFLGFYLLSWVVLSVDVVPLFWLLVVAQLFVVSRYGMSSVSVMICSFAAATLLKGELGQPLAGLLTMDRVPLLIVLQIFILCLCGSSIPMAAMFLARKRLSEQLNEKNEALNKSVIILSLAETLAGVGRWTYDWRTGEQSWSNQMFTMHGLSPTLGPDPGNMRHLMAGNGNDVFDQLNRRRDEREPFRIEYRIRAPDGGFRTLYMDAVNQFDAEGNRVSTFAVTMDVTEYRQREELLEAERARAVELAATAQHLANTDALTGLSNRRMVIQMLREGVRDARRGLGNIAIIIFDIDYFKKINDSYGHQMGDDVLVRVAQIAQQQARSSDLVGRIGGEEFVWLLRGVDNAEVGAMAERLRTAIQDGSSKDAMPRVTVSIGIASYTDRDTAESLLARADRALYSAKDKGRNCVQSAA
ncbi:sensor domain-containing diguanylate cyclase [Altericroceibacterium indicum]|uniref:sensor domain-containing diguanylate cyclase n=1 Tax=Altericroceibacterium indicum TaxID=374177 RepID=UPI00136F9881|nr:diguanylate cyclase [Altericroceibacterium indicum]